MALVPKILPNESDNAQILSIYDNTGVYDAVTNVGGFGTPNPEINDVTGATLIFDFDDIDGVVQIDFVIAAGVVTSAQKTDQLGNVETLDLADYNISAYPFPQNSLVEFPASFFFPNATSFEDQFVKITYQVEGASFDEQTVCEYLLYKKAECCKKKHIAKFSEEKCGSPFPTELSNAFTALLYQTSNGQTTNARNTLKLLKKLCKGCKC